LPCFILVISFWRLSGKVGATPSRRHHARDIAQTRRRNLQAVPGVAI
jgi:hypothetical protein